MNKKKIEKEVFKEKKKKNTKEQKLKKKIERKIKNQDNDKEIKKFRKKKPINFKKLNRKNKTNTEPLGNISKKKRMKWELIIALFILVCLIARVAFFQFAMGEELESMAYMQQTLDRNINPKRGVIFDSTRENSFSRKFNSRNSNSYTN